MASKSYSQKRAVGFALGVALMSFFSPIAGAADGSENTTVETKRSCNVETDADQLRKSNDHCIRFSVGANLRAEDLGGAAQRLSARPSIGIEYGRWSIGTANVEDWLIGTIQRRQSSLSYRAVQADNLRVGVSLSAFNVNTSEGLGSLDGGRYSVRARGVVDYFVSPRTSLNAMLTRDLLNRGGGTNLSLGVSQRVPISEKIALSLGASAIAGNPDYWRNGAITLKNPDALKSGLGALGASAGLRYKFDAHWVTFAQLGTLTPVGVLPDAGGTRTNVSGRFGFLYFGAF